MEPKKRPILVVVVLLLLLNLFNLMVITDLTGYLTQGIVSLCINRPPEITSIANQTANAGTAFNYRVNASDNESGALTYYDNTSLFNINSSGYISFTPASNGTHSILIIVADNSSCGNANTTASFILAISSNNTAPVLTTSIPNQSWEQDVQLTGLDLDNYFTDAENDTLTYTIVNGSNMVITISGDNVVTFVPTSGWYGITWAVFTANDSLNIVNSNNVTLTVTQTVVTPGTPGGGAGGGGGAVISEEVIREAEEELVCETQTDCVDWLPRECASGEQTRSCIVQSSDCSVVERIESRECFCQPQWQCTIWTPEKCPIGGTQERVCVDLNSCGIQSELPTTRACNVLGVGAAGREALFGQALFQNVGKSFTNYTGYWLGVILSLVIAVVIFMIYYSKKQSEKKTTETVCRVSPVKTKIIVTADKSSLKRKLALLKESHRRGFIKDDTYHKTRERLERLINQERGKE